MDDLPATDSRGGLTLRSVVLGFFFVVFIDWLILFAIFRIGSIYLVYGHLPVALLLPFVLLVAVVNPLAGWLSPGLRLRKAELAVIFSMGLVAVMVPEFRLTGFFLGLIASPYYFATTENGWAELLHPHMPQWLVPPDAAHAMRYFYEGLPAGESIPWSVWVVPVFWWGSFFLALFFVCLALVVILRKQWEARERLVFPLAELPLTMMETGKRGLPEFMRSRAFWVGVAIPLFVILWNMVGYFQPVWPEIPLVGQHIQWVSFGRNFPGIRIKFNVIVLGFAFLANLEVLFSIWFFYLLSVIEVGFLNRVGLDLGSSEPWSTGFATIGWQSFGGFFFITVWGLWVARRHIARVVRSALHPGPGALDDSDELLSCRVAVVGLLLALGYVVVWLHRMGMGLLPIAVFLVALLILYIGGAKIVAQSGLVYVRGTMTAQNFTLHSLGTLRLGPQNLVSLAMTFTFIFDGNPYFFPSLSHSARIAGRLPRLNKRAFAAVLVATFVVAFLFSVAYTLYLGYTVGAYNSGAWTLTGSHSFIYNALIAKMRDPKPPDVGRLTFFGIGNLVAAVVTLMRYRFAWWPIHPIGFAVCMALPVKMGAFSVFLAWLVKLIVLKVGGIRLYRKTIPLFTGLIVGYVVGVGLSLVVDGIWFMGQGHQVHWW